MGAGQVVLSRCVGLGAAGMAFIKYVGRENYWQYDDELSRFRRESKYGRFGLVSPGGVALILGVSRQRVHQIIARDEIDAYVFYESENKPFSFCEIPVYQVIRYGVSVGRINSTADIGLGMPTSAEMIEMAREELGLTSVK